MKDRVEELVRKQKADGLLPEEDQELADHLQLEHLTPPAKARARTLAARK